MLCSMLHSRATFFHLQKNASHFSIRVCVRGRCISWLMSLDVEITVWILDVCLLKGKMQLCLSRHKNKRKLFRLSNSLFSSNFLGWCDGLKKQTLSADRLLHFKDYWDCLSLDFVDLILRPVKTRKKPIALVLIKILGDFGVGLKGLRG